MGFINIYDNSQPRVGQAPPLNKERENKKLLLSEETNNMKNLVYSVLVFCQTGKRKSCSSPSGEDFHLLDKKESNFEKQCISLLNISGSQEERNGLQS